MSFPITGNTFPVKDQLRALGCRWDGVNKYWTASTQDMAAKAKAIMLSPATKQAAQRRPGQSGRSSPAETKRCWECGCRFTYRDAKVNGGDWGDSYCGC